MNGKPRKQKTVMLDEDIRKDAFIIAKRKGINTLSTLLNVLMVEYVEKNRDILERKISLPRR